MRKSLLSIGAISKACLVPVETIRTWERRYGFPASTRSPGGQRLYDPQTVELIRQAKLALDQGLRPAQAFQSLGSSSTVERKAVLVRALPKVEDGEAPLIETDAATAEVVNRWLKAAVHFDVETLTQGLDAEWRQLGLFDFLERRIQPFIAAIGEAWIRDEIGIAHEHFASDRLIDFLGSIWRPLSDNSKGPVLIGATLPMEQHAIGLHMAAVTAAAAGCRIAYLGVDTPTAEIGRAARQADASVFVSVSATSTRAVVIEQIKDLRRHLASRNQLAVGGSGARFEIENVAVHNHFREFYAWCQVQPPPR